MLSTRVFCVKPASISSFYGQPIPLDWALDLEPNLGASFALDLMA